MQASKLIGFSNDAISPGSVRFGDLTGQVRSAVDYYGNQLSGVIGSELPQHFNSAQFGQVEIEHDQLGANLLG